MGRVKPENILFRFYGKGARLRRFGGRAKPDIVNFFAAGFLQFHQLIVDGFQQGRFAFLHAHANLFFAEQVGQNFKLGFIRRFRQQTGEDGAVWVMAWTLPLRRAVSQRNIVIGEDASLRWAGAGPVRRWCSFTAPMRALLYSSSLSGEPAGTRNAGR